MIPAHHDGSTRYVADPYPELGQTVTVWATVPPDVREVHVRSTPDGEPHFTAATRDRTVAGQAWWRAEVAVRNPVTNYRFLLRGGSGGYQWLTALGVVGHDVPDATDFRLVAHPAPPTWAADAAVYEIFPDRFARSPAAADREVPDWAVPCAWEQPVVGHGPQTPRQFYGGDLDGVTGHLDHIAGLGANTVYLTPVFSARSNHRYDATTFDRVDPLLGGDAALHRLADALHRRGMRLIGDITSNHTGDAHEWFTGPDRGSLYYWYPDGSYECWCGHTSLPKLDWGSAGLRRRFAGGADSVVARWLSELDGWRVDVANMTGRRGADDHAHTAARLIADTVRAARPDALLVAEHGHDATGDLDTGGWQGTMNYAGFTRPVWTWLRAPELDLPDFLGVPGGVPRLDGHAVAATMTGFGARMSWRSRTGSWCLLGSHDTARIRTVVGDPDRVEVAVALMCTLPGTPMVFAGDELGLTGVNGEDARRPMPWARPDRWDTATLGRYRSLLALRGAQEALRHGGLRMAYVDADTLAYWRETAGQRLLVLVRRAPGRPGAVVPGACGGTNLYGGAPLVPAGDAAVELPADGPTVQVWACD